MVDVSVDAPQLALSEQPRTQIDSAVFNRPLQVGIGQGLQQLGAGAEDLAGDLAKTKAADDVRSLAVTLDANGVPQVATPQNSIILGQAGQDYETAFMQGEKARLSSDVSDRLSAMHLANQTDPAAFHTASTAYIQALRNNTTYGPAVGNALADQAQNEASQRFANISEKVLEIGTRDNLQAVQTQITDTQNKMQALARQGGTAALNLPEYQQLDTTLQNAYSQLGSTKIFGFAPERAASELANAQSLAKGEAIVGDVDAAFLRTGGDAGRAGAQAMLKQRLADPSLNLSIEKRDQFERLGLQQLDYLTNEQRAQIAGSRLATDKVYNDIVANKVDVPDSVIAQALAQAKSVSDTDSVLKLGQAAAHYSDMRAMRGLPDEQRVQAFAASSGQPTLGASVATGGQGGSEQQAMSFFQSKGWTSAQAAGIVGNLVRESGLRTGAINKGDGSDGSDSIGVAQWNSDRAAALKQFAAQQGKAPTDFQTQLAFVQHELETSESNAAGQLRGATNAKDAASAFALGYERPQGFLTGDINQVAGGADRVAAATRLAGGGASSAIVSPGSLPSASGGASLPPPSQAEMRSNPYAISVYSDMLNAQSAQDVRAAKNVGEALATQFAGGNVPSPQTTAGFFQMVQRYPEQLGELGQKVNAKWFGNVKGGAALATMTPAAADAYGDQVNQLAQGQDIFTQKRAEAVQDFIKKGAENLKSDMFNEAQRRGWITGVPRPVDFTQPDTLMPSIAQHVAAAVAVGGHTQNAATPAFAESELPMIKSVMTSGTLDQRTALLGAIANSGMPEPVLKATLGQFAKSEETLPLAVAGSIAKDDPGTARSILEGQALKQAEPKLAPNKDDFPGEFAKALPFNDFPQTPVRQGLDGAVQSLYAKLSASAGDTTGVLNTSRLQSAIDGVTGGIVEHRGSNIIAPWRGASKDDTDAAIRLVSDADLANSRGSDGIPLPASSLKPSFSSSFGFGGNWRLETYGDGKYLVFSGADDKRQYLNDARGGKFILDLGAKRSQVGQTIGRFQPDSFYSGYAQTAVAPGSNVQ